MCGIVGFLGTSGDEAALRSLVGRMSLCLSHRGPDDAGVWVEESVGLALGHRRLSILDLSPMGHQPMTSRSSRFTMTFNGEIYNYLEIRKELETHGGVEWRGHSDTEVILEAFARWGIGPTLTRLTGMFAMAVWDHADRTLHIA